MFVTLLLIWKIIRSIWSPNNMSDTINCNETSEVMLRHQINDALISSEGKTAKLPKTRYSSGALSPSPTTTHSHSAHRSSYPSGLRVSTYTLRIGPRLFRDKSSFRYF